jgi:hypothetical protein
MKIKTITLYNFSELSEQAQNRAAHKYQDLIQDIYEENVNNILEQKTAYWTKRTGIPIDKENISYSGFYSQGDGLSFITDNEIDMAVLVPYALKQLERGTKISRKILEIAPEVLSKVYNLYSFYICRYQGDRYVHSGTVYCHWECNSIDSACTASEWDKYDNLADELAALVNYVKNLICADIYQALQDENDYVSDIEHIKEYFKECDFYDWYEDGTLYTERK